MCWKFQDNSWNFKEIPLKKKSPAPPAGQYWRTSSAAIVASLATRCVSGATQGYGIFLGISKHFLEMSRKILEKSRNNNPENFRKFLDVFGNTRKKSGKFRICSGNVLEMSGNFRKHSRKNPVIFPKLVLGNSKKSLGNSMSFLGISKKCLGNSKRFLGNPTIFFGFSAFFFLFSSFFFWIFRIFRKILKEKNNLKKSFGKSLIKNRILCTPPTNFQK